MTKDHAAGIDGEPTLGGLAPLERGGRQPLGEAVYNTLCAAMRDGHFKPGDRLREEEIGARLNVSRTPVREAFNRLMSRGLLEASGSRGVTVRTLSPNETAELYALREILEGAAARLAAMHASDLEIEEMREWQLRFERAQDDARTMALANRRLHEVIFRSARNRYLDTALKDMQDAISILGRTTFSVAGRALTATAEHRAMIEAIVARNPDAAETRAREHIRSALRARMKLDLDAT